jgi:hypothetical protein
MGNKQSRGGRGKKGAEEADTETAKLGKFVHEYGLDSKYSPDPADRLKETVHNKVIAKKRVGIFHRANSKSKTSDPNSPELAAPNELMINSVPPALAPLPHAPVVSKPFTLGPLPRGEHKEEMIPIPTSHLNNPHYSTTATFTSESEKEEMIKQLITEKIMKRPLYPTGTTKTSREELVVSKLNSAHQILLTSNLIKHEESEGSFISAFKSAVLGSVSSTTTITSDNVAEAPPQPKASGSYSGSKQNIQVISLVSEKENRANTAIDSLQGDPVPNNNVPMPTASPFIPKIPGNYDKTILYFTFYAY